MRMKFIITAMLLFNVAIPSTGLADQGAMYEAWETGESIITEKPSVLYDSFFYSEDGETPPPPPANPRWGRFKSLEEHGKVAGSISIQDSNGQTEALPEYKPKLDPFANRLDDIEGLLAR